MNGAILGCRFTVCIRKLYVNSYSTGYHYLYQMCDMV